MIKTNKNSQESILKSGYRNQLKKHSQNSQSNKTSQTNKSIIQESNKSRILKQSRQRNQVKSQSSRNSSLQRAFNSGFKNLNQKHQNNLINLQSHSQVERYPFIPNYQQQKRTIQRHPSEPIAFFKSSQVQSQVNTQIQALNRLRQEYEIIKQVTSDDQYKYQNQTERNSQSNIYDQNSQRPNYIYESRQSVPIQIIKNIKLNKSITQKNIQQKSTKNPQKQDDHHSQTSQQAVQTKIISNNIQKQQQNRIIGNQQFLVQISFLQSALTQSSLKIEELLKESIKNKQKLRLHQQTLQKNHRLQNEIKMMKQTQKYLKRQIDMKQDEIHRFQKRSRIMKQTIQMMEKQSDLKDKQIFALQSLLINIRSREFQAEQPYLNGTNLEKAYKETMQKMRNMVDQKYAMNIKLINFIQNEQEQKRKIIKSNSQQGLKTYYTQVNDQLKTKLKKFQQINNQLKSLNKKLMFQLQKEQQKNNQLQKSLTNKIEKMKNFQQEKKKQGDSKQLPQIRIEKQIQVIQQQISKIKKSTQQTSINQVHQLQMKIRQLEETIRNQNQQKQKFIQDIQLFKKQHLKLQDENSRNLRQNMDLKKQKNQLNKQNLNLRQQINSIKQQRVQFNQLNNQFKLNFVSRQQYTQLQNEKLKLSVELDKSQRLSASQMIISDQQLLRNLNCIKEEYLKLEQAYLQKTKQVELLRLQVSKVCYQKNTIQKQLNQFHKEIETQRQYSNELQQKIHEKEMKIIQFLNISQNNSTYNKKILQLQEQVSELELKLREKQFTINQLQLQYKKNSNEQKLLYNQLKLQLSRQKLQNVNLKNNYESNLQQYSQQMQNYQRELMILKGELQQQQKHYNEVSRNDKQMMEKQIKLVEQELYRILSQKEKLMQQSVKMAYLQHELKSIKIKQRNNRKMTQNVDHLWMVKQAEYWNINQILNVHRQKCEQ